MGTHGKGREDTPLQFSNMHNRGRYQSIGNLTFFPSFPSLVYFTIPHFSWMTLTLNFRNLLENHIKKGIRSKL